ncbi:MAG: hypothetical protein Rhims3KO_06510 [Hyphomicrobiales bacterium]
MGEAANELGAICDGIQRIIGAYYGLRLRSPAHRKRGTQHHRSDGRTVEKALPERAGIRVKIGHNCPSHCT